MKVVRVKECLKNEKYEFLFTRKMIKRIRDKDDGRRFIRFMTV